MDLPRLTYGDALDRPDVPVLPQVLGYLQEQCPQARGQFPPRHPGTGPQGEGEVLRRLSLPPVPTLEQWLTEFEKAVAAGPEEDVYELIDETKTGTLETLADLKRELGKDEVPKPLDLKAP